MRDLYPDEKIYIRENKNKSSAEIRAVLGTPEDAILAEMMIIAVEDACNKTFWH